MKLLFDEKLFLGYHNPHGTKNILCRVGCSGLHGGDTPIMELGE
jgi:hypothetical protein